jgi:hypothetical protein
LQIPREICDFEQQDVSRVGGERQERLQGNPQVRSSEETVCHYANFLHCFHREVAKKIPGLNKEEMQLGNTKLFVRQPETYFDIEKLREIRIGDFVVVIQRAWRNYFNRKAYVTMQVCF